MRSQLLRLRCNKPWKSQTSVVDYACMHVCMFAKQLLHESGTTYVRVSIVCMHAMHKCIVALARAGAGYVLRLSEIKTAVQQGASIMQVQVNSFHIIIYTKWWISRKIYSVPYWLLLRISEFGPKLSRYPGCVHCCRSCTSSACIIQSA